MITDICLVVQARMGSTRLPGKVLQDLAGQPMLVFQLDRLRPVQVAHIVVATSELARDDVIADVAADQGVEVVRGPEADVLGRFGRVVEKYRPRHVVRLTADCPLTDPGIVTAAIKLHVDGGTAYTSNVHPRSFPKGLDVEVIATEALLRAVKETTEPYDREHVTPYFYRVAGRFPVANLANEEDLSHLWWTVDTAADLAHMRELVSAVDDPISASWRDFLGVVG